ncbi:TIGR03885 family FMN-dependent LLM class oxidoreductase [Pontibacter korlensis]|uniref:5,10-methylene tetrahydromethanopterin reductase n=1 Tax=Pontibacter korlensis TaxID=400092 RepID=A0A0E3ZDU9_9BACT|nr:TIGR03885 family FMN-dependent LLM class oxidoreductase [Pontibacter korlensis]AKD02628.1 5,10-methylene tetrahydromethanopterin reductase [Pontibacter korlensis]
MVSIGYHISHEQFPPSQLLQLAKRAEEAGFQFCVSSDHFHPWSENQGESGFAWSWLGAAMAQTSIDYSVVNSPTHRYHPAIIAQAAATLDEMFPGRFWISVGSGQALNEAITGEHWPAKPERNERLKESVDIMRALWSGETVTHNGLIKVEKATLYTRPKVKVPVFGAAITPETAGWLAGWADGLITTSQPIEKLEKVVEAWKSNGGENKPMVLKIQLSYDKTDEAAREGAHEQWKTNIFESDMLAELRVPKQFDQAAQFVKPDEMDGGVNISSDPEKHIEWLEQYIELGFCKLDLHNVNKEQEQFIRVFGEKVLPHFQGR